jgi:hypothetical protein
MFNFTRAYKTSPSDFNKNIIRLGLFILKKAPFRKELRIFGRTPLCKQRILGLLRKGREHYGELLGTDRSRFYREGWSII